MQPRTAFARHRTLASLAALALSAGPAMAQSGSLKDLEAKIDALDAQLRDLKKQQETQKAVAAPDQAVTGGATPGSFRLPGSQTSVTIGGHVKLDANYSNKSAGTGQLGDQFTFPSQIPVGPTAGANEREQITLHARQSRLFVSTSTPSRWGPITTLFDGDFFGADGNESVSNSHSFRIRSAYGTIGNLGGGQFWTNFFNEAAYAETVDFGGAFGALFVRQAQLRWTQAFTGGDWSVSAENAESVLSQSGTATTFRADDDKVPDLTARVRFGTPYGRYSVQLLARHIRVDSASAPAATDSRWGGAVGISGVIPTFGKDDLRFNVNAGNVIGRYQELGFFPDGHIDANGQLGLADVVSGYVAYRHYWTDRLRSSLVLAAAHADNPAGTFGGINRRSESAHLNLIWSPEPKVNLGAEYIYGKRVVEDGRSGVLNRVQLSAQYLF